MRAVVHCWSDPSYYYDPCVTVSVSLSTRSIPVVRLTKAQDLKNRVFNEEEDESWKDRGGKTGHVSFLSRRKLLRFVARRARRRVTTVCTFC